MRKIKFKSMVYGVLCLTAILVGLVFTDKVSADTEINGQFATVTSQKDFDEVVKRDDISVIDVNGTWTEFVAPKGDFSGIMVRFSFANAGVKITVPKGAHFYYFTLSGATGDYTLVNRGKLDSVSVYKECNYTIYNNATIGRIELSDDCKRVKIKGSSKSEILVTVKRTGKTVKIDTSKKVKVLTYGSVNLITRSGAQGSSVEARQLDIKVTLNNKAPKSVYLYDFFGDKNTVKAKTKKEFKIDAAEAPLDKIHKENWDRYSSTLVYDTLSKDQKELYNSVKTKLDKYLLTETALSGSILSGADGSLQYLVDAEKPDKMTDKEALEVFNILIADSGKYFFIDEAATPYVGEHGVAVVPSISMAIDGKLANGRYRLALVAKAEQEIESWIAEINANAETDEEKLRYLYDKICDEAIPGRPDYYHTSCSLFSGVKELGPIGYARTFATVANGLGYDCFVVCTGTSYYARVLVNGEWKYVNAYSDDRMYEMMEERYYNSFLTDCFKDSVYSIKGEDGEYYDESLEPLFEKALKK